MEKIPESVKVILWDVDIEKLDIKRHKKFIIERIIKYGNEKDVRWMLKTYSLKEIGEVVKKSRNIDRKSANYWALRLNIPREEIYCLRNTYQKQQ